MTLIHPDKLGPLWPWVRAGLDKVIERAGADWTPGQVYTALTSGTALLYIAGAEDGFMVVQRQMDSRGPILFVWALYGDCADEQDAHFKFTDELARSIGADRIRMESPRKGWARFGFKVKTMTYEREV